MPQRIVGFLALARLRRERHRGRAVGRRIRHREHDAHQRDAIGVAMVNAQDERAATLVVIDQVELPRRVRRIERRRGQAGDEVLQFAPAATAGKRRLHDVPLDIEMRVGFPECGRGALRSRAA